jgi:hypothetical protein
MLFRCDISAPASELEHLPSHSTWQESAVRFGSGPGLGIAGLQGTGTCPGIVCLLAALAARAGQIPPMIGAGRDNTTAFS